MPRMVASFLAVWIAIGAMGVLVQAMIMPIPNSVVSLIGLVIAVVAALLVNRRRRSQNVRKPLALSATLALVWALGGSPGPTLAATTNDDFANATAIGSFPFTDTVDVATSTVEPGEPGGCVYQHSRSVWYRFTPAAGGAVTFDPAGSFSDSMLALYNSTGPGFGGLTLLKCSDWNYNSLVVRVEAGATYYVEVTDFFSGGGALTLTGSFNPPPTNDGFANSVAIGSLPFSETTSNAATSAEAGEPACTYSLDNGSVWYDYTAQENGWLTATATGYSPVYFYPIAVLGLYTGTDVGSLTLVDCKSGAPTARLTFNAQAGHTYHLQVSGTFAPADMTLQLGLPPAPSPDYFYYPNQANVFGPVNFVDFTSDPAEIGLGPAHWEFGDGSTADGSAVAHSFKKDGDYAVVMTATSLDGRTASASKVVTVRTDDVGIGKLTVPTSAKAGQTRTITVGVTNQRYPETVAVSMWKGIFPNNQLVGQVEGVLVPVMQAGRTMSFSFEYTFTAQDAAIGRVTFGASVGMWISGVHDANANDNQVVALATRVNR